MVKNPSSLVTLFFQNLIKLKQNIFKKCLNANERSPPSTIFHSPVHTYRGNIQTISDFRKLGDRLNNSGDQSMISLYKSSANPHIM